MSDCRFGDPEQHDLYVINLVGDVKATPRDFYRYINSQKKKDNQCIPLLTKRRGTGITASEIEQAEEFNVSVYGCVQQK